MCHLVMSVAGLYKMSLPELTNSAGRPLPGIKESTTHAAPLKEGIQSDSGGHRHMSSSVPRTVLASGRQKAAMKKLKQRMTFSDHSVSWFGGVRKGCGRGISLQGL